MDSTTVTTISNETAELMKVLTGYLKEGGAFVKEQAPDVIQQLLAWKMAEAMLWASLCIIVLIVSSLLFRKGIKLNNTGNYNDSEDGFALCCGGGIAGIVSIIGLCFAIPVVLQIWIAPKVYLLEYLSKLL